MARTIDNLGIESSARYAEDQALLDPGLLKETRLPIQTQIEVNLPVYSNELDLLFETEKKGTLWATFSPPNISSLQSRRLFTELLIPHLGTIDKRKALLEKLMTVARSGTGETLSEQEDQFNGKKLLIALLGRIESLDKDLIDINSKRIQYQRG
jgi:hypothetical protein